MGPSMQGMNHVMCVPAADLQLVSGDEESEATSHEQKGIKASVVAAFWREWSGGKPVLVRGLRGQMCWAPAVSGHPVSSASNSDLLSCVLG
jgi:hypothetical protein